jgi:hypothetical protein
LRLLAHHKQKGSEMRPIADPQGEPPTSHGVVSESERKEFKKYGYTLTDGVDDERRTLVGRGDQHSDVIFTLKKLRQILIDEFSYDGQDPKGVKRYQPIVDATQELIDELEG